MREALRQATRAYEAGEAPVGAVIVREAESSPGHSISGTAQDATAHAEMLALTQAEETVGDWR